MIKSIEFVEQINTSLEQFKTSIDALMNQNSEYLKNAERYSNKEFIYEEKEGETLEERKNKADTLLDQLDDIKKRIDLEIQNVNTF